METILEILSELHPGTDFTGATGLIEDGVLTSLEITTLITEIGARLDVQIPAEEILPENFDSVEAIWAMVERLDDV